MPIKLVAGIVRRMGPGWGTVVITLACMVLSAAATAGIMWLIEGQANLISVGYGVLVPLVIAPPFSYVNLSLVQDLDAAQNEMRRLSNVDPLTGVANRREFMGRAEAAMDRAARGSRGFAVVMLDADNLKETNDAHGHVAGDALLIELARVCEASCRDGDTFARLGGDEFGFLLTGVGDRGVEAFSLRLIESIRSIEHEYDDVMLRVSVSVGTAQYLPDDGFLVRIIRRADEAMYAAKRAGGNAVCHG